MKGTLPSEIGQLSNIGTCFCERALSLFRLTYGVLFFPLVCVIHSVALDFAENEFTGTIPTEIGMLSSLAGLSLATNGFQGNLPTEMGNLNRLREFFP